MARGKSDPDSKRIVGKRTADGPARPRYDVLSARAPQKGSGAGGLLARLGGRFRRRDDLPADEAVEEQSPEEAVETPIPPDPFAEETVDEPPGFLAGALESGESVATPASDSSLVSIDGLLPLSSGSDQDIVSSGGAGEADALADFSEPSVKASSLAPEVASADDDGGDEQVAMAQDAATSDAEDPLPVAAPERGAGEGGASDSAEPRGFEPLEDEGGQSGSEVSADTGPRSLDSFEIVIEEDVQVEIELSSASDADAPAGFVEDDEPAKKVDRVREMLEKAAAEARSDDAADRIAPSAFVATDSYARLSALEQLKAEAQATAVAIHTGLRSEECLEAAVVSNLEHEARRERPALPSSIANPEDFDLETLDSPQDEPEQEWFSAWQSGRDVGPEAEGSLSDAVDSEHESELSQPDEISLPEASLSEPEAVPNDSLVGDTRDSASAAGMGPEASSSDAPPAAPELDPSSADVSGAGPTDDLAAFSDMGGYLEAAHEPSHPVPFLDGLQEELAAALPIQDLQAPELPELESHFFGAEGAPALPDLQADFFVGADAVAPELPGLTDAADGGVPVFQAAENEEPQDDLALFADVGSPPVEVETPPAVDEAAPEVIVSGPAATTLIPSPTVVVPPAAVPAPAVDVPQALPADTAVEDVPVLERPATALKAIVTTLLALGLAGLFSADSLLASAQRLPAEHSLRSMAVQSASALETASSAIGLTVPSRALKELLAGASSGQGESEMVDPEEGGPVAEGEPAGPEPGPANVDLAEAGDAIRARRAANDAQRRAELYLQSISTGTGSILCRPRETAAIHTATPEQPMVLSLIGDSMMQYLGPAVRRSLERSGSARGRVEWHHSTGLTRPDYYDWRVRMREIRQERDPDAWVVAFGGNDGQNLAVGREVIRVLTPEWRAEYQRRVGEAMDLLTQGGTLVYWIGLPIMRGERNGLKATEMNAAYAAAAAERPLARFIPLWDRFKDAEGLYADKLRDTRGRLRVMRHDDGMHLTMAGGIFAADLVFDVVDEDWALYSWLARPDPEEEALQCLNEEAVVENTAGQTEGQSAGSAGQAG